LQRLNTAYREKFGFPFLFAVKGSTAQQVLGALEGRLPREQDDEFAEALRQVYRSRVSAWTTRSDRHDKVAGGPLGHHLAGGLQAPA
jgi:2-oxo-4-hydroxy-4-carboxy-5-ureidoimidazoline decarboxylase